MNRTEGGEEGRVDRDGKNGGRPRGSLEERGGVGGKKGGLDIACNGKMKELWRLKGDSGAADPSF